MINRPTTNGTGDFTQATQTIEEILSVMQACQRRVDEYRRERDAALMKFRCPECGHGIYVLDRGRGEEWAMCEHARDQLRKQFPEVPEGVPNWTSGINGVTILPLAEYAASVDPELLAMMPTFAQKAFYEKYPHPWKDADEL